MRGSKRYARRIRYASEASRKSAPSASKRQGRSAGTISRPAMTSWYSSSLPNRPSASRYTTSTPTEPCCLALTMLTVAAGSSPLTCAPGTRSSRDAIGDQPHLQYSERTRSGHQQGDGPTLDDTFLGPVEPAYIVGPSPCWWPADSSRWNGLSVAYSGKKCKRLGKGRPFDD